MPPTARKDYHETLQTDDTSSRSVAAVLDNNQENAVDIEVKYSAKTTAVIPDVPASSDPEQQSSVVQVAPSVKGLPKPKPYSLDTNNCPKRTDFRGVSQSPKHRSSTSTDRSCTFTDVRTMSTQRKASQSVAKGDRLKQLQADSLQQISRKAAVKKNNPANSSVSIRDLDLARAPVNPHDPQSSFRKWAQDSPLYTGGYGEGLTAFSSMHREISVVPQASSTRVSHVQPEPPTTAVATECRRSKWAVKDEMKAERAETGSNDWGSEIPSDSTQASNASDQSFGKLLRHREPAKHETLHDWQGKMLPPAADWAERPRYNNNNAEFKTQFKSYVGELQGRFSNGVPVGAVDHAELQNPNHIPDGLTMVPRTHTIITTNAMRYGYPLSDPSSNPELYSAISKFSRPMKEEEFQADSKLDLDDEFNAAHDPDETTETLVTNWNKHLANARRESFVVEEVHDQHAATNGRSEPALPNAAPVGNAPPSKASEDEDENDEPLLIEPKLNIYLRPASIADLSELTRIYNWYVVNGSQPSELREIDEDSMRSRWDFCLQGKLPFVVAALKSQKHARRLPHVDEEEVSRHRQLPVTHKQPLALSRIERLAGFCCANDFSQPDFVEYIATDIEIYVDAQYRKMGVGKCLMDRMLHICDRGHTLTMAVTFHCDQELKHMYETGGRRELHKLLVTLRTWHTPKPFAIDVQAKRKSRKLPLTKTEENDYGRWMKSWFEALGFEEEGRLKKMGAKHGR